MSTDSAPRPSRSLHRWLAALALVIVAAVIAFVVAATRPEPWPQPVRTASAVGDSACLGCHRDKASYESTAHRLTMRPPTREAMSGSFAQGHNVLRTSEPDVHFRMDADSAGFYQTLVVGNTTDSSSRTEKIAYVAGSGRKGQSFLYWTGNQLYQLPVSYWTILNDWFGSPGRSQIDPRGSFGRGVAPRCFECHSTWIETVADPAEVNRYVAEGAILGITCERCHAAGQEHVKRERSALRPLMRTVRGPAIVNPARLNRDRQIESCAQCHAGGGRPRTPPFTYVAGQPLEDYLYVAMRSPDAPVDVHGNQVALLARSRCFAASKMTCQTCHDVHKPQRDVAELSGRCLTCHKVQSCGLFPKRGEALVGKCADCHMPLQKSNLVVFEQTGKEARVDVRNHWIRVYPETADR
jgi:hypothetical protein